MTLENILADFQLLDDWEDRYRYVIELGRALPPLPEAARTEANKVRGCASQVWLATKVNGATAGATLSPAVSLLWGQAVGCARGRSVPAAGGGAGDRARVARPGEGGSFVSPRRGVSRVVSRAE